MSSLAATAAQGPNDDASYAGEEQIVSALASAGDRNAARARLAGFIARHPSCAEAYNDLGVLAFEAGDVRAASSSIDQAIVLRPNIARYHRNRALLMLSVGDTAAGLAALARALILDPTDAETLQLITDVEVVRKNAVRPTAEQNAH